MAPLSLKIILDGGMVTRTIMFDTSTTVREAHGIVRDKIPTLVQDREYGFFLTSADDESSGVWLEDQRELQYYMLRDADPLLYMEKMRTLRVRLLDGSVNTLLVDESKNIGELMIEICKKIRISNYEEYGLCREDVVEEEIKPATGTLTLKRKAQVREKDAQLEQLSKILKTDDHVEWLDKKKTLRELGVDPKDTLLFKRRLYYSDRNIDSRDPVQLNLLYVQTRDAILDGRQIVTEDKAVEFAGLQCQIQYGDSNESKHKQGFIEDLREFLPAQYASRGIEKKVYKNHSKHIGLSDLEAKHLYIKSARALPTYGVTFFLVKEKLKGKKKLVPRLLGINSESILRLCEESKEILQVWPLTHVKSFRAAGESFTLDFGDYSDKEYAVKTNEAYRIKDILQGYIDIIRKRLAGPYHVKHTDGDVMTEEMVAISRGNIIQNVGPLKVVEQSYTGPSQIISVEQAQIGKEGTRLITVHEVVTTNRVDHSQRGTKEDNATEVPLSCEKRLNRINSFSVKTVTLLSEDEYNIDDLKQIVDDMERELPAMVKGIRSKATDQENAAQILAELDLLCAHVNTLSQAVRSGDIRSRSSFIADEKTEASLRRLSFAASAEQAHNAIEKAYTALGHEVETSTGAVNIEAVENNVMNKIGVLNGAVASLINTHTDSNNVDYSQAVACMSTFKEYVPELMQDIQNLTNENSKATVTHELQQLLNKLAGLCRLNGNETSEKICEAGNAYGEQSRKLIYMFNRKNRAAMVDKEGEIIDLANSLAEKNAALIMQANDLGSVLGDDARVADLDAACIKCADVAQKLLTNARITAPSISEPHCQSALSAACENLSSTAQHLIATCKPLVEDSGRHYYEQRLADKAMDLANALDKLTAATDVNRENNTDDQLDEEQKSGRIKFKATLSRTKRTISEAEKQLQENNNNNDLQEHENADSLKLKLFQKIAHLNALISSMLLPGLDTSDHNARNEACTTLSNLIPQIVQDARNLEQLVGEEPILCDIKLLLCKTKDVCSAVENSDDMIIQEAANEYGEEARKLLYIFNRGDRNIVVDRENGVIEQARDIGHKTSNLLMDVNELTDIITEDPRVQDLDAAGVNCADAAQELVTCAQLIAPTIKDPHCRKVLSAACTNLASSVRELGTTYEPLVKDSRSAYGKRLDKKSMELLEALEKLNGYSDTADDNGADEEDIKVEEQFRTERIKFVANLSKTKKAISDAAQLLNETSINVVETSLNVDKETLKYNLSKKIAHLNALVSSMILTSSDTNKDFRNDACIAVTELIPSIVQDARYLKQLDGEETAIWNEIRVLLGNTEKVCDALEDNNATEIQETIKDYGENARKLIFVFNRGNIFDKENEIIDKSKEIGNKASALLMEVSELTNRVADDPQAQDLDVAGIKCADATQELLSCAWLVAPSIDESNCQRNLLTACTNLSSSVQALGALYRPLVESSGQNNYGNRLDYKSTDLLDALDKFKAIAQLENVNEMKLNVHDDTKSKRIKFIKTLSKTKNAILDAELQLLDNNMEEYKDSVPENVANLETTKYNLSHKIAQLNAAISCLLLSNSETSDEATNYAVNTIAELLPEIVRDVKWLETQSDHELEELPVIDETKILVAAAKNVFNAVEDNNKKAINQAATEYANSSGKLYYIFNRRGNPKRENQILDLVKVTCELASKMLSKIYQLAKETAGEEGFHLDERGANIVDVAQDLLTAAQITSPSISDPQCKTALLSYTDLFDNLIKDLGDLYLPYGNIAKHQSLVQQICKDSNRVQATLAKIRKACRYGDDTNSLFNESLLSTVGETKNKMKETIALCKKDKLDDLPEPEVEIMSSMTKDNGCFETTSLEPTTRKLFDKLSQLNQTVALLVQAMSNLDTVDSMQLEDKVNDISQLTPEIVEGALSMHKYVDEPTLQAVLDEAKLLCEANHQICSCIVSGNIEELQEAAAKYANCSGKLFYIFSRRNSAKEAQVLNIARSACERTSLMLSRVSRLAEIINNDASDHLDRAGTKLADAAQVLLTNAQVTASSIDDLRCQTALTTAGDNVATSAQALQLIWSPLVQGVHHQIGGQLDKDHQLLMIDLDNLKKTCIMPEYELRQSMQLQSDLASEPNQANRNANERENRSADKEDGVFTIEENPLRQLASKILQRLSAHISDDTIGSEIREQKETFRNKLKAAILALDQANAKCRRNPMDSRIRVGMENALHNLQQICLLSHRDHSGNEQSNIVDLQDYINNVTSAAEDLSTTLSSINDNVGGKPIRNIREECRNICSDAEELSNPIDPRADDTLIDDMLLIENFAKQCSDRVQNIEKSMDLIVDDNSRNILNEKVAVLADACDILRFATKSSISSAASVAFDENIQNLTDFEKKIELMTANDGNIAGIDQSVSEEQSQAVNDAKLALCSGVVGRSGDVVNMLVQYAIRLRDVTPGDQVNRLKLKEHLEKLTNMLKKQTFERGRRVATWQEERSDDVDDVTREIVKEIESYNSKSNGGSDNNILNGDAIELMLADSIDEKKYLNTDVTKKIGEQIQKLNAIVRDLVVKDLKPELLRSRLHELATTATELTSAATFLQVDKDVITAKFIREATADVSTATYNLLNTSKNIDLVSPGGAYRSRLYDACRALIDATNKLARATSPLDKIQRECGDMKRTLQSQEMFLRTEEPSSALNYADSLDMIQSQQEIIKKVRNDESMQMSRDECSTSLRYVTSAVCSAAQNSAHCAYFLSLCKDDLDVAERGLPDTKRFCRTLDNMNEVCSKIICTSSLSDEVKGLATNLKVHSKLIQEMVEETSKKVNDDDDNKIKSAAATVHKVFDDLERSVGSKYEEKEIIFKTMRLMDAINRLKITITHIRRPSVRQDYDKDKDAIEVMGNVRDLINTTSRLVDRVGAADDELLTWVVFGAGDVIKAYETLLQSVRDKGVRLHRKEDLKSAKQDTDAPIKSKLETQIDFVNQWLRRPACKEDVKTAAIEAAESIIDMSDSISQSTSGSDGEELRHVAEEARQLLGDCTKKYNSEKASLLQDRLKDLKKMLERGVVTRVIEDFLEEQPMQDVDVLRTETKDEKTRAYLLDKKIADLLAQLSRVSSTARFVSATSTNPMRDQILVSSHQTELLAPNLVRAAHRSIVQAPDDQDAIEEYRKLVMEYAASLGRVRELCDRAVDPMEFAQTAGETMARIKEAAQNDPQQATHVSRAIMKLGSRVVQAGMSSANFQKDAELRNTLNNIKACIESASHAPRNDITLEIIRKTGEVESVLGGENIFHQEPQPDQPIYAAAHGLHAAVRDWSARDNDVVAAAKRVAVLMAQLSRHMDNDNKVELIATSKAIVAKSREVAALATKLALECSDLRIRNSLLQVCDRVPTVSGQLKMLTTVKGSSLGHMGREEDKEAMTTLVANAQNLMISIQEVVKNSESASVKIMSQRGRRIKWVRRYLY
ncbi:uncharacterized protein LOC126970120 isoform X2 [Leptidea sinapis]|uniref:uncharacterized protein LOC126970120 isoform X2 n=1 Tax=Leptidea sinapis TaxID=189913 RepID=UPI002135E9D4|nr:uncharacterized protein LOC126970120 isoform X2 [Leptidea sinapis]